MHEERETKWLEMTILLITGIEATIALLELINKLKG